MRYSRVLLPIYGSQFLFCHHNAAYGSDVSSSSPGRNRAFEFDSHSTARNFEVLCGDWEKNRWPMKGESDLSFFGGAVATSDDGLTIAIGSSQGEDANEPTRSYVKVYTQRFSTGYSTQLGNTITGVPSAGRDVSLSSDGRTIAIANVANENSDKVSGEVNVYKYHQGNDSWARLGGKISVDGSFFQIRTSIELSGDGKTLVFGGSGSGFSVYGKTRVFRYDETKGEWVRKGRTILESGDGNFASIEVDTSISKDGNIIAIGSSRKDFDGNFPSRVRVFRYNSDDDSWDRMGSDLFGATGGDLFGASVSLGHDGSSLAIGSDGANNNTGNVRIFKFTYESEWRPDWTQIGQTISGHEENTYFGRAMAFSTSNEIMAVVVGSFSGTEVFQYKTAVNNWESVGNTMDFGSAMQAVGASVAISGDGQRIVVGLPMNSINGRNAGMVQTYELNKGTCAPTTSPSIKPSESKSPSHHPTSQPTSTSFPSNIPSISPSNAPSQSLVPSLSMIPSIPPTEIPTASPSMIPTGLPSSIPTIFPTTKPSVKPSLSPTASPSVVPSLTPTPQPTPLPSGSPTSAPTSTPSWTPSRHPTLPPTEEPTDLPSPSPTVTPTRIPTVSPRPTPTLSVIPSNSPTTRLFARLSKMNNVVEVNEHFSGARRENANWTITLGAAITILLVML